MLRRETPPRIGQRQPTPTGWSPPQTFSKLKSIKMPLKRKSSRWGKKKRGVARKGRSRPQRSLTVAERASCSETIAMTPHTTGTMYRQYNLNLSLCRRAATIGKGYQFFRIKSVKYLFKPLVDTFIANAGTSVPHLYCMIDRTKQLLQATNVDSLKRLGAKPRRLDDKTLTYTWRPSVLNAAYDNEGGGAVASTFTQYKISPWLPVREADGQDIYVTNSTDHLGLVYTLENAGGASVQYSVEYVVEFEFKKPSYNIVSFPTDPPAVDNEDLIINPEAPTL